MNDPEQWDEFDIWCLRQNIESSTLTARRMMHLAWVFFTEGAPKDKQQEFLIKSEQIGESIMTFHVKRKREQTAKTIATQGRPKRTKLEDVTPPPGWKSDEQNYAGIQAMLGMMSNVKGAVSKGKEVKR